MATANFFIFSLETLIRRNKPQLWDAVVDSIAENHCRGQQPAPLNQQDLNLPLESKSATEQTSSRRGLSQPSALLSTQNVPSVTNTTSPVLVSPAPQERSSPKSTNPVTSLSTQQPGNKRQSAPPSTQPPKVSKKKIRTNVPKPKAVPQPTVVPQPKTIPQPKAVAKPKAIAQPLAIARASQSASPAMPRPSPTSSSWKPPVASNAKNAVPAWKGPVFESLDLSPGANSVTILDFVMNTSGRPSQSSTQFNLASINFEDDDGDATQLLAADLLAPSFSKGDNSVSSPRPSSSPEIALPPPNSSPQPQFDQDNVALAETLPYESNASPSPNENAAPNETHNDVRVACLNSRNVLIYI